MVTDMFMTFEDRIDELCAAMKSAHEEQCDAVVLFLHEIFHLLFWKDYRAGYLDLNTERELVNLFYLWAYHQYSDGSYYSWKDRDAVKRSRETVRKVRKIIGLTEPLPD